jgi:DNA-binding NarL/FixJ family response regulator
VPDPGEHAGRRLTPREREVLEHAALGLSNRQIGAALEIAEQTVKNHLNNAMRKLSLHDRTHAVVFAIGSGLIRLPVSPGAGSSDGSASERIRGAALEPSAD